MNIIFTNIYLFILSLVLAILEIQIEGPHGWAKNLPTWRPNTNKWWAKLYSKVMSNREITGYHLTMFAFVLLILHLPYVFGLTPTLTHWLKTISLFFIFIVLWDFLWFVLNPYYPLKNFKKEHISWHKKWFLKLPIDYYYSILVSLVVLLPFIFLHQDASLLSWWLTNIALFISQTILVALFTLYILKIDNWQQKMP